MTSKKGGGSRGRAPRDIPQHDAASIRAKNALASKKPKATQKRSDGSRRTADTGREPPPGYRPPRGETKPSRELPPPSTHRERLLPLLAIGSRKFEELCEDIASIEFQDATRTSLKRTTGVEQYGVDVEAFDENGNPFVVVSAKCYRVIKSWDFRPWIEDFTKHLDDHWKDKGVHTFVLAVSHECNDDDMNAAAKAAVEDLKARGIRFLLWNAQRISRIAGRDVSIVDRYFNKFWVEAISAGLGAGSPVVQEAAPVAAGNPTMIAAAELLRQASEFASSGSGRIGELMAARLDEAIERLRTGRSTELKAWLSEARATDHLWSGLSPSLRAKALRAFALLQIRDGLSAEAASTLDEADRISEPQDASARAYLAWAEGRREAAFELVAQPASAPELEAQATFLLEAGRSQEAASALERATGDAVTPRILRLRAIATFALGNREGALKDASSARERAPDDINVQMTLGSIRLLSALVAGVRPQFGAAPQPINPGLLRDSPEAVTLLELAHEDFSRLLGIVDPSLGRSIEIWKLAALLLNPARREEGADLARDILKRSDPDPTAVAWAGNFDLIERPGRIRKLFGDAVREERGTVSHLVVFALLSAGLEQPKKGLQAIRRYEHLFPDERSFLDDWKARFGGPAGTVAAPELGIIHASIRDVDNATLVDLLVAKEATVEDVLSGAEFLAWRSGWNDLDRLRPKLLAMDAERPRELAALAPLNAGRPADCLAVLSEIAAVSPKGRLPRRFITMRIRANEELGQHRPIIEDLMSIRRDGDDPFIENRLFDAYLRIGALSDARNMAERLLNDEDLRPDQALRIAYVLRSFDAETARRALTRAGELGIRPEAWGAAASLAADLGLSDLQDRFFRLLGSVEEAGAAVIRFDTVEQALAFIDEQSREYQSKFDDWLHGMMPAVLAMQGDIATYARLFLANPEERKNQVGHRFPMLLLSGAPRSPVAWLDGTRPVLRMDLSALLLAERLSLLPDLDRAFSIRVPNSVAEALMEIQSEFQSIDGRAVEACRAALSSATGSIRVVHDVPDDASELEPADRIGELDAGVVAALLDAAFQSGHIDRDVAQEARCRLGLTEDGGATTISSARLTPRVVFRLAAAGILEPIARGSPVYISEADAAEFEGYLRRWTHDADIRTRVGKLLEMVSEKLREGRWSSVSRPPDEERAADFDRMPPHLRCVMEIIGSQEGSGGNFWVEERAFSHKRIEGAVQVHDVLDALHSRGFIATGRRSGALRYLRRWGYAFAPTDTSVIASRLEAAAIKDNEIVETPELAEIRIWFADEVSLLGFIDTNVTPGEDGDFDGELKRILELEYVARTVLTRIWANRTASLPDKRARSNWAWLCLRSGRITGLPADLVPETRRYVHAASLALVVAMPFFIDLSEEEELAFDARREFMDWFVDDQLAATAKADDRTIGLISEIVARLLSGLLDRSDEVGAMAGSEISASLTKVALRLLVILPDDLRERILELNDLRRRLGVTPGIVLHVGADFELEPEVLTEAYQNALLSEARGGPPSANIPLTTEVAGRLELGEPDHGLRLVKIETESRIIRLDAATSILLDPDRERRLAAMASIPELSDPRGWYDPTEVSAAAGHDDANDRYLAFKTVMDRDFRRVLRQLRGKLHETGRMSSEDLELPEPSGLLGFLKLRKSDDLSGNFVARAAMRLEAELDLRTAILRLAASPLRLPREMIERWGTMLVDEDLLERRRFQSPLSAALRMRALATAGVPEPLLEAAGNEFLEAARLQAELFAALVRQGAVAALRSAEWLELSPLVRVVLLWLRADHLTRAMAPPTADAAEVADWVRAISLPDMVDVRLRTALPEWELRMTWQVSPQTLVAVVAGEMIREGSLAAIPGSVVEGIKSASGHFAGGTWMPALDIIATTLRPAEELWAGEDALAAMVKDGWLAAEHPFAHRDDATLANRLLEAGESDPDVLNVLPTLLSVVDFARVDDGIRMRALNFLKSAERDPPLEPDSVAMLRILDLVSQTTSGRDDFGELQAALSRQARRCAEKWPHERLAFRRPDNAGNAALVRLVNQAYSHSGALPRSGADRMQVFGDLVRAIVDAWPAALLPAIVLVNAVIRDADYDDVVPLWSVMLELRGRRVP